MNPESSGCRVVFWRSAFSNAIRMSWNSSIYKSARPYRLANPRRQVPHQAPDRSRVVTCSQDLPRLLTDLLVIDDVQIVAESIDHRFEEIDVARQGLAGLIHVDADVPQPGVGWLELAVERLFDERCLAHALKAIHNDASTFSQRVDQPRHFEFAPEEVFPDGRALEDIRIGQLCRFRERCDNDR